MWALDRSFADEELLGDRSVGIADCDQVQHLQFTGRQALTGLGYDEACHRDRPGELL
ncbi:MAG: hypothetical protein M5U19_09005 [Microthrixaceae bacterium]|nr:hypothetical protein [Microthrixaceae bacterium]